MLEMYSRITELPYIQSFSKTVSIEPLGIDFTSKYQDFLNKRVLNGELILHYLSEHNSAAVLIPFVG